MTERDAIEILKDLEKNYSGNENLECNSECQELGFIENHKPGCKAIKKDKFEKMKKSGVSVRIIEKTVQNDYKKTNAVRICEEYIKNTYEMGDCLILSGGTGIGKSLSCGVVICEIGGLYVYAGDLQKMFLKDEEIYKLKSTHMLIIDDLGVEYKQEWLISQLDSLLNYRYGEKKATIITTNLNAESFKNAVSERIVSRIREWGKFEQLKDVDLRRSK